MNCPNCHAENPLEAKFCQRCGTQFDLDLPQSSTRGNTLIFIGLSIMTFASIYWFSLSLMARGGNWEVYERFENISHVISFLTIAIPLLIGLGIRRKGLRVVAIIFAVIITLIRIYWFLRDIFPDLFADPF